MKHLHYFETRYNQYFDDKLRILKKYIKIISNIPEKSENANLLTKRFFIILHNFLIIEHGFYKELKENNYKEIDKYINLENCENIDIINEIFLILYDPNGQIRYNLEKFNENEIIKSYFENRPHIFEKLINKYNTLKDIEQFKLSKITSKYNI